MAVNLGQLRTRVYNFLREDSTNTHFSDATVINGFLNEAAEFAAVFIEYQRDLVSVQAQNGVGSYPNPTDTLIVRTAYFGDRDSITSDIRPLKIVTEEALKEIYPSWMDQTTGSTADRPSYLMQLDRKTIYVYPRPNGVGSAAGKKIYLNYNYVPTSMVVDSDTPDLPLPYHNLLPLYALHLCYISLQNPNLVDSLYKQFMEKVKTIKNAVTQETKDTLGFSWGYTDIDVETPIGSTLINP